MARIMCLDIGGKRTGIAVTDALQIIATGLDTIEAKNLIPFLKNYIAVEQVELILVGMPLNLDGTSTHATPLVEEKIREIKKSFPSIGVETLDERFSSRIAKQAMLQMGLRKKARRDKKLVDEIAATMMLQEYLQSRNY